MKIINLTKDKVIAAETIVADRYLPRLRGLLFRSLWSGFQALYLKQTGSIHTIGLCEAIDIITIDCQGIVKACKTIKPWNMYIGHYLTRGIIECPQGTIKTTRCEPGDQLMQINGKGW